MCFSTEASFTAATILGIVGGLTLKKCKSKSLLLLSVTPLLFATQQLSEGVIWLFKTHGIAPNFLFTSAVGLYLIFAFLIWPIWFPLILAIPEKINWRRYLIYIDLAFGAVLLIANLFYALGQKISVEVVNHSIQYLGHAPSQELIYPLIVLLPCFLSSLKNMWVFGVFVAIGYIVAQYFYMATFVSIWCFFSAVVSLLIYKIVKDNN